MTTANFAPNQRRRLSLAACKNYAAKVIFSAHIRKHLALSITIGLFLGTIGTANAVLSVTSAKTIEATPPYLTFDSSVTKALDTSELLSITLSDGNQYTTTTNTSSAIAPISLPVAGQSLSDIQTYVPSGNSSILNSRSISCK